MYASFVTIGRPAVLVIDEAAGFELVAAGEVAVVMGEDCTMVSDDGSKGLLADVVVVRVDTGVEVVVMKVVVVVEQGHVVKVTYSKAVWVNVAVYTKLTL